MKGKREYTVSKEKKRAKDNANTEEMALYK